MLENFRSELEAPAKNNGESFEHTIKAIRKNFDGYHFAKGGGGIYNQFTLLNTFYKQDIQY
jgi:hypothetical protein